MNRRSDDSLAGRLILLGVTGSIAAYKSAELARLLTAAGADVQPLMTHSAQAFLGPLTLETLTRRRPMLDPLELLVDGRIGHIVAAETADAVVVAPATARWLAAMATGLADDVITATCLASTAPVVIAPAMDGEMYGHPATQANVERLRRFGYTVVEPESGPLASGATGRGRLAEPARIVGALEEALRGRRIRQPDAALRPPAVHPERGRDLDGWHVVVTCGGTAEPIDPVRFIGNRSSGRMGVALAEAALGRGARVTLIAGMTSVPLPEAAEIVTAPTTADMRQAVLDALPDADALVMAAAVADFRPRQAATTKLGRQAALTLELEPTEDVLAEAATVASALPRRPLLVGFAAETGSLERAAQKAAAKGVDVLVANDVAQVGSGFGTQTNRVTILVPGQPPEAWPLLAKREVAERLFDRLVALRRGEGASLAAR
ncbi:MAG: bifunctional phosphopantothenoylcysteine decarboxylase/phosphopantothenate--cysteine ligase CoaBC [Chloroflexota bacterium]|nr:bifunctional phosphopantothenoylcysteine decarboxylase/phosphopantothenate--cysteine ligase CoaBC [Chloroflexota bacterium]